MSASSMAKAIRSSIHKIYIPIIVLLVFCIPYLGFTEYAFADTTQNYVLTRSGVSDATANFNTETFLGTVSLDGVYVTDFTYRFQRPNENVFEFIFYPSSFDYNSDTAKLSALDFVGYELCLYLPRASVNNGTVYYPSEPVWEWVTLVIGDQIYDNSTASYKRLFVDEFSIANFITLNSFSTFYNAVVFEFDASLYSGGLAFHSEYTNYYLGNILQYIAQTFVYYGNVNSQYFNFKTDTNFTFNVNYFPGVLTYVEKEQLISITEQKTFYNNVTNDLNDILNYGSGSFDDLEQDIVNASDKAEQGNQEIEDNAPKPNIDDTHDDTTNIIDSVLTENGENVSNILGAILGSNIINGMLLISISVGAIKYIFFGKG